MRLPAHQMALITSGCVRQAARTAGAQLLLGDASKADHIQFGLNCTNLMFHLTRSAGRF